ncbi:MAG: hypothetical protein IKX36_09445 [Prevotella sp.]|nr:hypothetical protein [Prevotella sp.]
MNHLFLKRIGLFVAVAFMVAFCFFSCSKDGLPGKKFQGYYHPTERISLKFETNSKVVGEISSTDFVGNFADRVYGNYEFLKPYIKITWMDVDSDNEVYKSVISNPDTIMINESLDTIRLWDGNDEFVLPKCQLYNIDKNASVLEQIGQYCSQSIILIFVFIIKYFFYIVAAVIFVFVVRWWKKKRK